jgi:Ca2+-dependent lipid-binding protein
MMHPTPQKRTSTSVESTTISPIDGAARQHIETRSPHTAIGVIKVIVHSAGNIDASKIGDGMLDTYVIFSINNRTQLARTKHKHST